MKYDIVVTNPAQDDLEEILNYISVDLSAPKSAIEMLNKIKSIFENLSINPLMYPLCNIDNLKEKNYRKAVINNYLMFYRVDDKNETIYIMRFIYGRRDYINLI